MKKILLAFVSFWIITSCRDSSNEVVSPPSTQQPQVENQIILTSTFNANTEAISLNWTISANTSYSGFRVMRADTDGGIQNGTGTEVGFNNGTSFNLTSIVPFKALLEYQVIGIKSNGEQVKSNIIKLERPEIKLLNLKVFDAQFEKTSGKLFLLDTDGKIALYDVNTGAIINQINTNATLGYSDIGYYNGDLELYVPRSDGWVDIYNGNNLALKDQIYFDNGINSTIYHDGKLFASTTNYKPIKCKDRGTKSLISESTSYYAGRMKKIIEGGLIKLYTITQNSTPTDLHLFNFDLNGNFVNDQSDTYHGDYPLGHRIFDSLPNGRIITSNSGTVYNSQMIFQNNLPSGNLKLSSFDYDSTSIIAGNMNKTIDFYDINSYTKTKSVSTSKFPVKVFSYGNKVVSISSITLLDVQSYSYSNIIPENVIIEIVDK